MLNRARSTGVYDDLVQAELGAFLDSHDDSYDLILCGDTLNYFGKLDDIMRLVADRLKPSGRFVFTLEAAPDDLQGDHGLGEHGRYVHERAYVERVLQAARLAVESFATVTLRKDGGKPVEGFLVQVRMLS